MEINKHLGFEPTLEQASALSQLETFVDKNNNEDVFILKGSAGTGKTSIVKVLTEYLNDRGVNFFIAAPTGRAVKVISSKTNRVAKTLHSLIYTPEQMDNGGVKLNRKMNTTDTFTVYIVDESSMVTDELSQSNDFIVSNPLLSDLLHFVKQGNSKNKIVFVGDAFQLPPVKSEFSPALSETYMHKKFKINIKMAELKEVKRQDSDSYILKNATALRNCIMEKSTFSGLNCRNEKNFTYALHRYLEMFDNSRLEKIIFLALSNRDVNFFNNAVRDRLFGRYTKPLLTAGDVVTLHANWIDNARMLMKGESGVVKNIDLCSVEVFADLRFANAEIEFSDSLGEKFLINTTIMLDVLNLPDGNLHFEKERLLFAEVMKHNAVFRESKKIWDDKFLSSMRLRYGYASTCHKAQGGEWETVIVHPYYAKKDYRWLYTAVTRAKKELYSYAA